MSTRPNKKLLVGIPLAMLAQARQVAEVESRTISELIREALRRYLEDFRLRRLRDDREDRI